MDTALISRDFCDVGQRDSKTIDAPSIQMLSNSSILGSTITSRSPRPFQKAMMVVGSMNASNTNGRK